MTERATVILWRHGATDWNAEHRFQGSNADVPLNAAGLEQARQSAPAVAAWHQNTIVCSPLERARQTCAEAEAQLAMTCQVDKRLTEINVGAWCGMTPAEAMALDPGYAAARAESRDYRHGISGETGAEVAARSGAAIDQWAQPGQTLLVVSHGWALQLGTGHLLGWDYTQSKALAVMDNCAWSVLSRVDRHWRIESWNIPLV
jgi:probable phosphoglycerate mutase